MDVKYCMPVIFSLVAAGSWAQARQGGFEGPGRYAIANAASHQAIELDRLDHRSVIQSPPREHDSQRWDIKAAGPELFFIRNAEDGRALDSAGVTGVAECARFNGGETQQWRIEALSDGGILILSRDGRALEVPKEAALSGARLRIAARTGSANQRFSLRRVLKTTKEY
jgi:hypothetical protein